MRLCKSIFLLHSLFSHLWLFLVRGPTGSVTITGTPVVGQTLTADNNLSDADGLDHHLQMVSGRGCDHGYGGTLKDGGGRVWTAGWCVQRDSVIGREARLCRRLL